MAPAFEYFRRNAGRLLPALVLSLSPLAPSAAMADAQPQPSALSSRIVTFVADPENTYVLYLHPGMVTDIKLAPGERLEALAMGDTVQWLAQQTPGTGDVFVKPVRPGIETSASLVTTAHTYQLMLVSRESGDWYQEVRFKAPSPVIFASAAAASVPVPAPAPSPASAASAQKPEPPQSRKTSRDLFADVDLQSLRFDWCVNGTAPFAPVRVLSSPDFVWIELPEHTQAPVVFARQGDQWGIVNYDMRGDWLVVQTQATRLQLRAAGQSVELYGPGSTRAACAAAKDQTQMVSR